MSSESNLVLSVSECSDKDATNCSSNEVSSFQRAKAAVDKTVSKLTSKKKIFPIFKEYLQPYYKNDSKGVRGTFESMMNQLDTMLKEEIDLLFESSNLEQHLNDLDTIKKDCVKDDTSKTWRPSGNPEEDLEAHLQESSEQELQHFEKIHAALLSKNKWLNDCVERMSSRNISSVKAFDDACEEWEEAASAMTEDTKDDIIQITNDFSGVNFLEEES